MLDPGWSGVIGALVGGGASLGGTVLTGSINGRTARAAQGEMVAANALLMQDDFYHFQVTIARALDRCGWWSEAELLPQQASVSDRKTVWAALPNTPLRGPPLTGECLAYLTSQSEDFGLQAPNTVTNAVADAQGWLDYLTQRHKVAAPHGQALSDFQTMKWVFALLDVSRRSLQVLARRSATDFSHSHIFDSLDNCHSVADLFARPYTSAPEAQGPGDTGSARSPAGTD
ncbi:MAG: hypothetical protein ACRDY0_00250 [Acidimicrobiales bacterium]